MSARTILGKAISDNQANTRHLNATEGNVIVLTKEEQEEESLPALDLKQNVNRKTGEIECTVH